MTYQKYLIHIGLFHFSLYIGYRRNIQSFFQAKSNCKDLFYLIISCKIDLYLASYIQDKENLINSTDVKGRTRR